MNKLLKVIEKNKKIVLGVIIGLSLGGIRVFASTLMASKEVSYIKDSNTINVQEAIEELYELTKENTPLGHIIVENGFRYTGENPNNYVLFNDELWRMIGIFDGKIKIIRNESIGSIEWNSSDINDWQKSTLYNYLNTTYYNTLKTSSKNMIENANWKVGGGSTPNLTTQEMYESETGTSTETPSNTVTGFIGLMSASDYGYASSGCYRGVKLLGFYNEALCKSTNWLNEQFQEWLITPVSAYNYAVFMRYDDGKVSPGNHVTSQTEVRPSLYLKKEVYIISGSGTHTNPYSLKMQ